jgi:hypothetical protein
VPAGRYAVFGDDGVRVGTEEFRCAPGPMGWRYFSDIQTSDPIPHVETFDVVVDADWRPVRIRADTGEHQILLEPHGGSLQGVRDGVEIHLPREPDRHIDYLTPAANLITTRRLTGTAEIDVVFLAPVTLEPTLERQRYELIGREDVETPVGHFATTKWRYTSLDDGWTSDLWVAGDVVVRYDRLFELEWYEAGASGPQPIPR